MKHPRGRRKNARAREDVRQAIHKKKDKKTPREKKGKSLQRHTSLGVMFNYGTPFSVAPCVLPPFVLGTVVRASWEWEREMIKNALRVSITIVIF